MKNISTDPAIRRLVNEATLNLGLGSDSHLATLWAFALLAYEADNLIRDYRADGTTWTGIQRGVIFKRSFGLGCPRRRPLIRAVIRGRHMTGTWFAGIDQSGRLRAYRADSPDTARSWGEDFDTMSLLLGLVLKPL